MLFREGDPYYGFYVVLEGKVKVYKLGADGRESMLHIIGPLASLAEIPMFLGGGYPAYAETLEDSTLLCVFKDGFLELLRTHPELSLKMLAGLSRRLKTLGERIEKLTVLDVKTRLARYLLDEAGAHRRRTARADDHPSPSRRRCWPQLGHHRRNPFPGRSANSKARVTIRVHGKRIALLNLCELRPGMRGAGRAPPRARSFTQRQQMKPLAAHSGDTLQWLQPKALARRYELRGGDDVFAALEFRSSMGTLAVAESSEGTWTFKRVGFLHPRVTVRLDGSERDVAEFHPAFFGGGNIEIRQRNLSQWKSANFWSTKWGSHRCRRCTFRGVLPGSRGRALSDLFKTHVTVEIHWHGTPGIPLVALASLGMYLLLLQEEEASTAATDQ
ncbi:MAG: Crp/Fnr family transcriptional regulator [Ignavibacteria bacterium]|nr:Crp/Fnr family transcriptional regulator [Ignavibacteria bacterium]